MSYQTYVVLGLTALVLVLLIRLFVRELASYNRYRNPHQGCSIPKTGRNRGSRGARSDRCALTLHSSRVLASLAVFESSHYLLPIIQALETHRFCIGAELKGKIF